MARLHDLDDDADASRDEILRRSKRDRERAAADRAKAADDRRRARHDREEAARDRSEALRQRVEDERDLKLLTTDQLTGAWTRHVGLREIGHELERAHRTHGRLVLAFVDVDGLEHVNDAHGHLAGDALLELLGATLRANVRPYDLIVRYGGDELLCAMPDISAAEARTRFEAVTRALRLASSKRSVSFGLAEAASGDDLHDLIGRADADLLEARAVATPPG